MEDFSTIIWLAVAIIFSAASAMKRANKQRTTSKPASEEPTLPEPWPLFETAKPAVEKTTQTPQKVESQHIAPASKTISLETIHTEAVSLETVEPEIPPTYNTTTNVCRSESSQQKTHTTKPSLPQTTQSIPTSIPNEESLNTIDFDLKKAVIYAEILKPKFNEE